MRSRFSIRLKERRNELGMRQGDLAEVCDLTPAAISQFETDLRKPSYESLQKLSTGLYVTIDFLIGRKELETEDYLADSRVAEMLEGC